MATLREQIEFYPPGLIIIRGTAEASRFIQDLPPEVIGELNAKGYVFFVLPKGTGLESVPDSVLEQAWRSRQAARRMASTPESGGVH